MTSAKTEGVTPGVFAAGAGGKAYLFKVDGEFRPEQASAADLVGSRIHHAAGYNAPCNRVVFLRPEQLTLGPEATREDIRGEELPLRRQDLDAIVARAARLPDGRIRALASELLPGEPLGPFRYSGTRKDDPNDVIPLQHRRELRASGLLAAWLRRIDIREQNSLDVWVSREAIDAIGGLRSAEGQLVDDTYLGARVQAAGYGVHPPRGLLFSSKPKE